MKYFISIMVVNILLSGCVTPLSTTKHGDTVSEVLEVENPDLRFVSYGEFVDIPAGSNDRIVFIDGVVALTGTDLYLLEGKLGRISTEEGIRIPIVDMDVADIYFRKFTESYQLQIKYDGRLILVNIRDNKIRHDSIGIQKLYTFLVDDGVAPWETTTFYENGMRPQKKGYAAGDVVGAVAVEAAAQSVSQAVIEGIISILLGL